MSDRAEKIREVTRRLVLSLGVLLAISLLLFFAFRLVGIAISVLALVMAFGICGGFISVQRRLRSFTDEDLSLLATSWPYIFLPPLTGGVLAVVLYLLFVSGLLAGDLFPRFEQGETSAKDFTRLLETTAKQNVDYGKIMFWSFVAGFSESFVTNIIGTFTKSANKK